MAPMDGIGVMTKMVVGKLLQSFQSHLDIENQMYNNLPLKYSDKHHLHNHQLYKYYYHYN